MNTWQLVFEEDFSAQKQLNLDHWVIDTGDHGGGNNAEAQYYTPGDHNLFFEDGALVFEGRKEKYLNRDYTSAKIWTKGKLAWQYGRFEIIAKLPSGKGTWPAIWTLGVKQGREELACHR
jgi:beta-glucanase (GH16 family)